MEKREYDFWVYIAASRSHQLYTGVTNSLMRRMKEHKAAPVGSYTARYRIDRLVYFEHFQYVNNAIARETQLKDWNRSKKIGLIESLNPTWQDLSEDWGESLRVFHRRKAATEGKQGSVAASTAGSSASLRNDNKMKVVEG